MKNILISTVTGTTKIGVFDNEKLEYFFLAPQTSFQPAVGDIYYSQVVRVSAGIEAAFIDIGTSRTAFLHKSDIYLTEEDQDKPIDKILTTGQKIVVQIIKTPMGTKGARLSTKISIASSYLVYLPHLTENKISSKILDEDHRVQLLEKINSLNIGGLIARTAALEQSVESLNKDCDLLKKRWELIEQRTLGANKPGLILKEIDESLKVIRDFAKYSIKNIFTDSKEQAQLITEFCHNFLNLDKININVLETIHKKFQFSAQIAKINSPTVSLSCGGSIIIEQTESMTTIDVNTAKFLGKKSQRETILKTNLQAADKIMAEIKLRQIGGIIIVDFIDMDNDEDKVAVEQKMLSLVPQDIMPLTVYPFSDLGLIQMSRKRSNESIFKQMTQVCPCCQSAGRILNTTSLANMIVEEVIHAKDLYSQKTLKVLAAPAVIAVLEKQTAVQKMLLESFNITIKYQAEDFHLPTHYEIISLH